MVLSANNSIKRTVIYIDILKSILTNIGFTIEETVLSITFLSEQAAESMIALSATITKRLSVTDVTGVWVDYRFIVASCVTVVHNKWCSP